jgi:Ca-activated chloride channel family protein
MQWDEILKLAQSAAQPDEFGLRAEFVDLVKTAKSLSAKPVQP